jgi:ParB-like chromosome segregation protein Spo0J
VKVVSLDPGSLTLDPENARVHGEENLDAIRESLERFGQRIPIVVDGDGVVRAGNGRVLAARALGWKKIFAVRVTDLSEDELRAFSIADNRTSELATWDSEVLARVLSELRLSNVELADATGFSAEEVTDLVEIYGRKPELLRDGEGLEGEPEPIARLDQRSTPAPEPPPAATPAVHVCPSCGFEFEVSDTTAVPAMSGAST